MTVLLKLVSFLSAEPCRVAFSIVWVASPVYHKKQESFVAILAGLLCGVVFDFSKKNREFYDWWYSFHEFYFP